jgi:nitroimidazol reductase NimA-like FMN-containing flavoprotein (pyridoxamine 5'-phosphate oxidase superfamily)
MEEKEIRSQIQKLLDSQLLAVLATQKNGQPYSNLIAFACVENLKTLLFATPRPTRKYSNLSGEPRVSLLVDNRSNLANDFYQASAVTVIGEAKETNEGDLKIYRPLYIARHPYLESFVTSPSTSLIKVTVKRYIMVSHFQKVVELILSDESDLFT